MPSIRILIADDHEIVRRSFRSLLGSRTDWQVCGEAEDGVDAIEKAKHLDPDLILMDISMPRLNGLEATRILRREVPRCEIVIVSQNESSVVRPQALAAGARGFVSKADLSRDLLATLDAIVKTVFADRIPAVSAPEVVAGSAGATDHCLRGGGEIGALMRSLDWSKTRVGEVKLWPRSLKTAVGICLNSRFDLLIWWGPHLTVLYNDAYSRTLAAKHPAALGRPGIEVWPEIWDVIGPMLDRVMKTGEATWSDDLLLLLERHGYPEETYHTFSYTPILDDSGGIGGVFTPVTETTVKVIGERRLHTLRDLAARSADAKGEPQAWSIAAEVLSGNPYDIPFALLYRLDDEGRLASLAGKAGLAAKHDFFPLQIRLGQQDGVVTRLLTEAVSTGKPAEFKDADNLGLDLPGGVWGISPSELIALPLAQTGQSQPLGVLFAGVNRRKLLDESYRTFFNLVAGQISKSIADAQTYEKERKRAEALAELDRAKTTFFSNVSHEFRTPLTLMLGPLEDVLADVSTSLPADARKQLDVVHRNGLRLLKLVNSLLDFSRIEAGRVQAVYQPTDLAKVTADLASVFRSAMEKAGLQFKVECAPLSEPIFVDADMWEKIVLNLLSNAYKYTFAGQVSVCLRKSAGSVELEVQDTGTGITETELPRLFERFHRVEGAPGRTHEGTGIGLALVQELAKLHGGSVSVQSHYGQGSKFTVSIPRGSSHLPQDRIGGVRDLASTALRADSYVEEALRWLPQDSGAEVDSATIPAMILNSSLGSASDQSQERELILLADDNSDMREYVRRLLSQNHRVHAVSNGQEAVAAARKLSPDMILTDVMMPGLDGFGVLRAVREDASLKAVPVILLSARAGEESRLEGLQAGADDYLVKPFTARELLARVGAHLNMARIRREASELEHKLRAEADLERTRLRELLLQAPAAIAMTTGPEHRFAFVNTSYLKLCGRTSQEEFVGRSFHEALPELIGQGYFELLNQVYRTGKAFVGMEMKVNGNRGADRQPEDFYVNFVYQPMRNLAGEVEGILIHAVEVTEQVTTRKALQAAHDELEHRVKERTAELERAEAGLRTLSGRLLQAQDEERRRIARELHDSAGQILTALNMNLAPLERELSQRNPEFARPLADSLGLVDELSSELRTLSYLLHPPLLDEAGLASALRWFVEGFAERSKIPVDLELTPNLDRLPAELETTIFRIIQECLTNIHRHSGSPTASIRITRDTEEVRVEIRDYGTGLASNPKLRVKPGVGIQGMRERVRHLRGTFTVKSGCDGTLVVAALPTTLALAEDAPLVETFNGLVGKR